jgi:hypothetical protein
VACGAVPDPTSLTQATEVLLTQSRIEVVRGEPTAFPQRRLTLKRIAQLDQSGWVVRGVTGTEGQAVILQDYTGPREEWPKTTASWFALSAFSQVSTSIHFTVERLLYRHRDVDAIGWTPVWPDLSAWDTQKQPIPPAGCLCLLLCTLESEPARFVQSVHIRWSEYQLSPSTIQE